MRLMPAKNNVVATIVIKNAIAKTNSQPCWLTGNSGSSELGPISDTTVNVTAAPVSAIVNIVSGSDFLEMLPAATT